MLNILTNKIFIDFHLDVQKHEHEHEDEPTQEHEHEHEHNNCCHDNSVMNETALNLYFE